MGFHLLLKKVGKNLSGKYSQKPLDGATFGIKAAKKNGVDALKTASKRAILKTAEETRDLIGNKTADAVAKLYNDKITKVSKT